MAAMDLLKRLSLNVIALALATFIGAIVVGQAAYTFHVRIAKYPTTPLVFGLFIAIVVAAIAPRTKFLPRFLVFTGIFLLELALFIVFSNSMLLLTKNYWDENATSAKPWGALEVLIHVITFTAALVMLRRFRLPKPTEIDVEWAR